MNLSLGQKGSKLSKGSDWGGRGLRAKLTGMEDLLLKLAEVFGTEVTTVLAAISYNSISNPYFLNFFWLTIA